MRRASRPLVGALALVATGLAACGASIQAVYEGDVRFEHCMALDSRPDVKPTLRRACWQEWVRFYTFGQTRDRVEYAKNREKQLSGASDFDEQSFAESASLAVPDPTSALAPPPMMLTPDGGTTDAAAGAPATTDAAAPPPPVAEDAAPPAAECTAACETTWQSCRGACKTPGCDKECTGKYKRCMRRCF